MPDKKKGKNASSKRLAAKRSEAARRGAVTRKANANVEADRKAAEAERIVREPVTPLSPVQATTDPAPVTRGGVKVNTALKFVRAVVYGVAVTAGLLVFAVFLVWLLGNSFNAVKSPFEVVHTQTPVEVTRMVVIITAIPAATEEPSQSAPAVKEGVADVREMTGQETKGNWDVTFYEGATDQMHQWVRDLGNLVTDWSLFPNVDYAAYGFDSKDGVEYGMDESAYCQRDQTCDVNVPARHYRLVTGDYNIPGIDSCSRDEDKAGCGIALFNVGEVTAIFRESMVDYGFTVEGRYWNGDAMPVTIRALLSHTAYNMLNMESNVNMGANCSLATGCDRVRLTYVVLSGNQVLVKGTTFVSR